MLSDPKPKPASESATEMVEVVLPDDANPMGFMLGGNVMRLIDLAGAAVGFSEDYIRFLKSNPIPANRGTITGRAALERRRATPPAVR